jgi:hypothetical protein
MTLVQQNVKELEVNLNCFKTSLFDELRLSFLQERDFVSSTSSEFVFEPIQPPSEWSPGETLAPG